MCRLDKNASRCEYAQGVRIVRAQAYGRRGSVLREPPFSGHDEARHLLQANVWRPHVVYEGLNCPEDTFFAVFEYNGLSIQSLRTTRSATVTPDRAPLRRRLICLHFYQPSRLRQFKGRCILVPGVTVQTRHARISHAKDFSGHTIPVV